MRLPPSAADAVPIETPAQNSAGGKLDIINGLRGVAIVAVVWHHLFGLYFKAGSVLALAPAVTSSLFFLSYGWIGVQLFFVLSGFVLYLPFARGRAKMETSADWRGFYRRRAARLLPLYYLVALLCLVLNQVPPVHDLRLPLELISIAGALFTFAPHGFEPHLNPPLWSLGVEIWFSILFPFMVLAFQRWGIVRTIVAATVLSLASRTLGLTLVAGRPIQPLTMGLTANLEIFAVGMALAQAYVAGVRVRWPRLVTLGGALALALAVVAGDRLGRWIEVPFDDFLVVGFAAIIAGLLSLERGWLRAAFASRPVQVLGMMCFSLYVWHEPLLRNLFQAEAAPLDDLARTLPIYLFLLLTVAALSYRFVEFGRSRDWRALFLLDGTTPPIVVPTISAPSDADLG
ncbi:MAG TPA: acyltransferase [Aliidongia sp.]|uniref:acyltransferase family protein n=1 Tax=Aliidongia sp. TaxID=1914230 RepID=UPI002DDCAE8B|nr:acyltransferase [Aliidongia sp.]HEV2673898.1 acyltransferase [Aliidongia sp.]